jgi:D-alanine-D-alanine ligase
VSFSRAAADLPAAVDLALAFDEKAIVERAVLNAQEVNCSVRRVGDQLETSSLELVSAESGFLTYDQKYLQWSKAAPAKMSGHQVPANLPDELEREIQSVAVRVFEVCQCDGLARIDCLVQDGEVFANEINTLPGSLSFYLWEPKGITFPELLQTLVEGALQRAANRHSVTLSLDQNLLSEIDKRKGLKSAAS